MNAPARRERAVEDVLQGIGRGDMRGLARALSWIEDGDARGIDVIRGVHARTGRARRWGVTGSPGAGKSTLVDHLARQLAASGRRVAVIAVDPSSAFSGGAILGDRIRMVEASRIPGLFIRSTATRGHLGGLARTTEDAVDVIDAFGFDDVIIETVGVGQDEVEVIQVAHVVVVVLVPFMGDDVQALKAGIMEIADVYVINKADREGADRMEAHVRGLLQLQDAPRDVPILRTVATRGEGVAELLAACGGIFEARAVGDDTWRKERVRRRVQSVLRDRLLELFLSRDAAGDAFERAVDSVVRREADPHAAVDELAGGEVRASARFEHLGVAVPSIAAALGFWRDALGLAVDHEEDVATERVRVAMLPVGEGRVELLEPLPGDGPVRAFLDKRGAGIHHACFEVDDLSAVLARLRARGVQLVGDAPRPGAHGRQVAFIHPRSASGVLVELTQRPGGPGRATEGHGS